MISEVTTISKFISLVLRHKPETIGLVLDANGWANVDDLLRLARQNGTAIDRALLEKIVAESDKKRFAFDESGERIRANQGHSIDIDLALSPAAPPTVLYHGTATRFLDSIRQQGLVRGQRQHVHLSADESTALRVGQRHGKPVVLQVAASEMVEEGHLFYLSANGVWLTDAVPTRFLVFP